MFKMRRLRAFVNGFRNVVRKSDVIYILYLLIVTILTGAVVFNYLEGWGFWTAVYTTVITLTSVGYGDFTPVTAGGRVFATVFTLLAVGIVGYAVSTVAASMISQEQKRNKFQMWEGKMEEIAKLRNHIILCGGGSVGRRIAKEFQLAKESFIIIEPDIEKLYTTLLFLQKDYDPQKGLDDKTAMYLEDDSVTFSLQDLNDLSNKVGVHYLKRDASQDRTLLHAGIAQAKGLVSAFDNDKENLFVVLTARQLARKHGRQNFRIISRVTEEENIGKLEAAGADRIVSPNAIGGLQLASEMVRPNSARFWDRILRQTEQKFNLTTKIIAWQPQFAGKTIDDLRDQEGLAIVGLMRAGKFYPDFNNNTAVETGDQLIALKIGD